MKKVLIILASTALLGGGLYAGKTDKSKTSVVTCGEKALECTSVVNAIGDVVKIDVSKLGVTDLGTISSEVTKEITLPTEAGSQKVYSFTPTTGESANELVNVVFDNIEQRRGTRLFGKTQIKLYRRFASEPEDAPWIEVGQIEVDTASIKPEDATESITLKPDGTASWTNPATQKTTVFQTGVKKLG